MLLHRKVIFTVLIFGLTGIFSPFTFQCLGQNKDAVFQNLPATIPLKGVIPESLKDRQNILLMGVSDPGIADTALSKNQALARAMFLYALQHGSAGVVTEYYNRNNESNANDKFEDLYVLNCDAVLPGKSFKPVFYMLETGECIALLIKSELSDAQIPATDVNATLEIYNKELMNAGHGNTLGKLSLSFSVQSVQIKSSAKYSLRFAGLNRQWIESEWDRTQINVNPFRCFYDNFSLSGEETGYAGGSTTLYGLWYAMLREISGILSEEMHNQYQRTKSVEENYQQTLSTMQRNSGKFNFNRLISDFCIVDNTLKMKWNKINQ